MIAAEQGKFVLETEFPDLLFGQWNCRKISGSTSWSQHSWGNGLDMTHQDYGYSTDPTHQAYLDSVAAWLDEEGEALSVWSYLWRTTDHYDHIHVDFEPRGWGTPPCAAGLQQSVYQDGRVVDGDPGPVNGEYQWEDEPMELERWATRLRNPQDFDRMETIGVITETERNYWVTVDTASDEFQDLRDAVQVRAPLWQGK